MMFETNWVADFPDGDNFYQLLYGANRGRANYALQSARLQPALRASRQLGDTPQRTALYR
jgi:ABC-type oligopeptide transport system substrate-binding subunit